MRAGHAVIAAAVVLLVAPYARALCPNCLGQASALSSTLAVVGVFLLVPPAVFVVVAIAIRRLARRAERSES